MPSRCVHFDFVVIMFVDRVVGLGLPPPSARACRDAVIAQAGPTGTPCVEIGKRNTYYEPRPITELIQRGCRLWTTCKLYAGI